MAAQIHHVPRPSANLADYLLCLKPMSAAGCISPIVCFSTTAIGRPHVLLILATLVVGLLVDVHSGIMGQIAVGIGVWTLMLHLLNRVGRSERYALMTCLTIATLGEMFCSLIWGLYTYRLHNIPLFVPPGHVLLFLLGLSISPRMSDAVARAILGLAALYAVAALASGLDTLAVPLFVVFATASLAMPQHRRLFATTFLLSFALELYGTWLGNWAWAAAVPGVRLITTNPPGLSGAFYCALDALVAMTSIRVVPLLSRAAV